MGVVKGDRLARSGKLAKLPLTSALAYSWIVSVSRARDDFGAFQWDPGGLRALCFPLRPEVTAEMVADWLEEWCRAGLVIHYRDRDGVELGVFTNFQGETQPRFHRFDLPPELGHECRPACAKSGLRVLSKHQKTHRKRRQRRASGSLPKSDASVLTVLTVPTDNRLRPAPPAADVGSWSRQACDDWIDRFGGTAPGGQIGKALKPLVKAHAWPAVRQAWRSYLEQTEAEFASPSRFASTYGRWAGTARPGVRAGPSARARDLDQSVLDLAHRAAAAERALPEGGEG